MHFSEDDLRSALRQKDPGAGFTQRVMARINQAEATAPLAPRSRTSFLRSWWPLKLRTALMGALVAVMAVAAWFGVARYRDIQERRAGEEAKQKTMLALRITTVKLNHVFERVRISGAHESKIRRERL